MSDWRERERSRMRGEYTLVPWAAESWWREAILEGGVARDHFAHVSTDDPSKLAYTEDERKGEADRQTRVKPGRYLKRYFGNILDAKEIQRWAQAFAEANESNALYLAFEPDEIQQVYENGPRSCMGYDERSYESSEHPVRMYGAGDLAVAYISSDPEDPTNDPTARTIVWPSKKIYCRTIYGDAPRLRGTLESEGYKPGDFDGARLLYVEESGGVIAPFVDFHPNNAEREGKYLVVRNGGRFSLKSTNGISGGYACDHCSESVSPEDTYTVDNESWCEGCYQDEAFYCEYCNESSHVHNLTHVGDDCFCESCADEISQVCEKCNDRSPNADIREVDGDPWCDSCCDRWATYCEVCEEWSETRGYADVEGDAVCEYCLEEHTHKCGDCEEYTYSENAVIGPDAITRCLDCERVAAASRIPLLPMWAASLHPGIAVRSIIRPGYVERSSVDLELPEGMPERQTVRAKTHTAGGWFMVEDALVIGSFAVYPCIEGDGYACTHLGTGLAAKLHISESDATRLARELDDKFNWRFSRHDDEVFTSQRSEILSVITNFQFTE